MKKIISILGLATILSACANSENGDTTEMAVTDEIVVSDDNDMSAENFVLVNIVDSIIKANPDYMDNEIKRKKVARAIQEEFIAAVRKDHEALTQIPLTYKMMRAKGNKYIVKFELSNIGSSGTRISRNYDIYFNVFTEMTEDEAMDLVSNNKYHLTFSSIDDVSNKLVLPSGETFVDNPTVYKFSDDKRPSVSPGAFLLINVKYDK